MAAALRQVERAWLVSPRLHDNGTGRSGHDSFGSWVRVYSDVLDHESHEPRDEVERPLREHRLRRSIRLNLDHRPPDL